MNITTGFCVVTAFCELYTSHTHHLQRRQNNDNGDNKRSLLSPNFYSNLLSTSNVSDNLIDDFCGLQWNEICAINFDCDEETRRRNKENGWCVVRCTQNVRKCFFLPSSYVLECDVSAMVWIDRDVHGILMCSTCHKLHGQPQWHVSMWRNAFGMPISKCLNKDWRHLQFSPILAFIGFRFDIERKTLNTLLDA